MRPTPSRVISVLLLVSFAVVRPAAAIDVTVPSVLYPDFTTALTALKVSPDVDNTLFIGAPSVTIGSKIELPNDFNGGRHLVIRPDPTLGRAQIRSTDVSGDPIFDLLVTGFIRFLDLDILRVVTNNGTLIRTDHTSLTSFERCCIGSSGGPNAPNLAYMDINYPADGGITIRNCIFFSTSKIAFAYGINASLGDHSNALYLYNNCIADYDQCGLQVNDAVENSLVLLRNNVLVNNTISNPEPVAIQSAVIPTVIVVTSHNLVFASPANVQAGSPPNLDLYGTAASQHGVDLPATLPEETNSFSTMAWDATPGAFNANFYRTLAGGPLHDPGAYGVIVGLHLPDVHDQAVLDDFDRSIRPGGSPLHVDRGPFQVDPSTSGVADLDGDTALLRVLPARNPASSLTLVYASGRAGELSVELLDTAGRRVGTLRRTVRAGASGLLAWPGRARAGVYLYRARLVTIEREVFTSNGRVSVVR